jgi:hypothetical protein
MKSLSMVKVRQRFERPRVESMETEIRAQLGKLAPVMKPGMSVAITAGSRGINEIPGILAAIVRGLKDMGAQPYLVSAMGSHGGGTAEGQEHLLAHLGITEASVGAPLRVTSEAVAVGTTESGHVLYVDGEAVKADAILLVNRIKSHTAFQDLLASGLFKMLTVGLGKVPGATQVHRLNSSGMFRAIVEMGRLGLEKLPVIGGLAIIENGFEETARLELLLPSEMERREQELLKYAEGLLPTLPVQKLDLLIIEEMGKNFSGTGMDTNVIGRWKAEEIPDPEFPKIGRIVILRLSKESEGNANGLGLADVTTRKLVEAIDWTPTLTNVKTTGFWQRAFCPPFPGSDRDAIHWAIDGMGLDPDTDIAAARIRNTLHIEELWLTPKALAAAAGCEQVGTAIALSFNDEGDLLPAE